MEFDKGSIINFVYCVFIVNEHILHFFTIITDSINLNDE